MNKSGIVVGSVFKADEFSSSFDAKSLPEIIEGQVGKLNDLNSKVQKALSSAELAQKKAVNAKGLSAGRGIFSDPKRAAIEGLQGATVELAAAVQSGAEAQKISFEFQECLAEISQYLLRLGVSNIAKNRMVVRELEMRLSGASAEELSDLARKELLSVIHQLKEQQDILHKQERIMCVLEEHDGKVAHLLSQADDLQNKLVAIETCQDARYEGQVESFEELQRALKEWGEKVGHLFSKVDGLDKKLAAIETCQESRYKEQVKSLDALQCELRECGGKVVNLFAKVDGLDNKFLAVEKCQEARYKEQSEAVDASRGELAVQKDAVDLLRRQFEEQQVCIEKMGLSLVYAEKRDAELSKIIKVRTLIFSVIVVAIAILFAV